MNISSDAGRAGDFAEAPYGATMAAAVAFFASDEASYITGQTLSVNGGRFMF